jgi:hypothetical protein
METMLDDLDLLANQINRAHMDGDMLLVAAARSHHDGAFACTRHVRRDSPADSGLWCDASDHPTPRTAREARRAGRQRSRSIVRERSQLTGAGLNASAIIAPQRVDFDGQSMCGGKGARGYDACGCRAGPILPSNFILQWRRAHRFLAAHIFLRRQNTTKETRS